MIENQGKTKVVNEVMDLLKKNWDSVWKIWGWQSGSENREVKWERVNFV